MLLSSNPEHLEDPAVDFPLATVSLLRVKKNEVHLDTDSIAFLFIGSSFKERLLQHVNHVVCVPLLGFAASMDSGTGANVFIRRRW